MVKIGEVELTFEDFKEYLPQILVENVEKYELKPKDVSGVGYVSDSCVLDIVSVALGQD